MLTKGQIVYIYLNDLEQTLLNLKKVLYSRFGYIEEIKEYEYKGVVIKSYKVKTSTNTTFQINGLEMFNVCSLSELQTAIENIKENLTQKEYNSMISVMELYTNNN